jgi:hypothetical protein
MPARVNALASVGTKDFGFSVLLALRIGHFYPLLIHGNPI